MYVRRGKALKDHVAKPFRLERTTSDWMDELTELLIGWQQQQQPLYISRTVFAKRRGIVKKVTVINLFCSVRGQKAPFAITYADLPHRMLGTCSNK